MFSSVKDGSKPMGAQILLFKAKTFLLLGGMHCSGSWVPPVPSMWQVIRGLLNELTYIVSFLIHLVASPELARPRVTVLSQTGWGEDDRV